MPVKILFIADVVGKPGRTAVSIGLDRLVDRHNVDVVIANGENAAGGFGITDETAADLFDSGVHLLTTGNHIWDKKESVDFIRREERLIRPANYPEGAPGRGSAVVTTAAGIKVGVLNLQGRVFMGNLDCPFSVAERELSRLKQITPIIIVDFHAEATSEKVSLGWFLAGRVSAVLGTHTHVQTADERILPGGTAYITDVGMTGGFESVIGIKKELAIEKFMTQLPVRFEVAKRDVKLNAVLLEINDYDGTAINLERISISCP
jgi:metallophosphoesterase (TIGR00282 family)